MLICVSVVHIKIIEHYDLHLDALQTKESLAHAWARVDALSPRGFSANMAMSSLLTCVTTFPHKIAALSILAALSIRVFF